MRASGKNKIVLLAIATLAMGMFFIPSTVSLFAGQHTFDGGGDVSCRKCHEDIYSEIYNSGAGLPHVSFGETCMACHTTGYVWRSFIANVSGMTKGVHGVNKSEQGFHAATTVECVFCHDLVPKQITNVSESHTLFFLNATSTRTLYYNNGTPKPNNGNQSVVMLKGANTACVGCHTHVWVNATWVRNSGYGMDISETGGVYNITFSLNNTKVTTYVQANNGT